MVTVYFESKIHAEKIATFETEALYDIARPSLELEAKKHNMIVTESIGEQ